jgi:RimJ/RimL family protein N-acetyltransferase
MDTADGRDDSPKPIPHVTLETQRLLLRPWEERDIPEVYRICQDADIQRYTTVPSPYQLKDAEWFILDHCPKSAASGTTATFGVFLKESGRVAGAVSLMGITTISQDVRTAEIGYWGSPETRGNGYLTEAAQTVVRWGFGKLGLERIIWQAYAGNDASRRVAEKAGFTVVGLQRGSHTHRGERLDMWLGDMLPADLGA